MTNEQIEKFLYPNHISKQQVKINFKNRNPIVGLFIEWKDSGELKEKNFWRVVTQKNIEAWQKSKDMNLVKIFSGNEFTKLALAS
jgi:hypothetical protein